MLKARLRTMLIAGVIAYPIPFAASTAQTGMGQSMSGLNAMTNTAPIVGGTIAAERQPKYGNTQSARVHMSATRQPCVQVNAYSRPQIINPNSYDNVLILRNSCPDAITLNICYLGTEHCITPSITGYSRREATLGTSSSTKDFRFQYRENF